MHRCPTPLLRRIRTRASRGPRRPPFGGCLLLAALSFLIVAAPVAADPPTASYSITGIAGTNGWYRGSSGGDYVVLHWQLGNLSQIDHTVGCEAAIRIDGPTSGATRTCTAYLIGGGSVAWTTDDIKIDADPPTGISASVARKPDANGWYNHPLEVHWTGGDSTSGIAACSTATYSGPDGAGLSVGGGCTDNAGNSASVPVTINYDATPPVLSKVTETSGTAANVLGWRSSSPSDTVVIRRRARDAKTEATIFRGSGRSFADKGARGGLEYVYSVQAFDQADNASKAISAVALPRVLTLRKTPYVPRAARDPILRWEAVPGASYYHVQLFRAGKRILAAWPNRPELGLPATWKWAGHGYRLAPGLYRWYVWAGLGRRSFARYRTIGTGRFVVPQR